MIRLVHMRRGHAPGHVRDMFLAALEAFGEWDGEGAEPGIAFSVNYVPRPITLSQACGLLWHCTDVVPGMAYDCFVNDLERFAYQGPSPRRSYAGCAQAMKRAIEEARS